MEPIVPHNDTLSAVVTQCLGLDDFHGNDDETPIQLHIPEIPVPPVQPAPLEVGNTILKKCDYNQSKTFYLYY